MRGEQPQERQRRAAEAPADGVTGVSGSGKSSLLFGTIAAESQRLINETYSAFVQGLMPRQPPRRSTCWRADNGDHGRPGAHGLNPRSTVGTATEANAMLPIVFSRLVAHDEMPECLDSRAEHVLAQLDA